MTWNHFWNHELIEVEEVKHAEDMLEVRVLQSQLSSIAPLPTAIMT